MNSNIQLALWIVHPVLELLLIWAMLWRRLQRSFPVFFAYIVFQVLNFLVLFPIYKFASTTAYFYAYWISKAISLAIGFKVIHEIFLDVFRPYHTLKDLGTVLFKWAALVMVLVAIVVTASSQGSPDSPLVQAVIIGQRCVRVIQCGLILFLLLFSGYLGVSWRQHSFGIALGLGGFATVDLVGMALFSGGQIRPHTLSLINAIAYSFAIFAWIGYASLKTTPRNAPANMRMSQRWEQGLGDLRNPVGEDSLIPMFERMVDRAFSHSPAEPAQEQKDEQRLVTKLAVPGKAIAPLSPRTLPRDLVR
jgi:uncharacterized membrane protein (DUF373 family)